LETIAPSPEQLEAIETLVAFLVAVFRDPAALDRVATENANILADNTRLKAYNTRLTAQRRDLQAALDAQMEQVMQRQRDGLLVELPPSILAARRVV
jgi:hypothetical protein